MSWIFARGKDEGESFGVGGRTGYTKRFSYQGSRGGEIGPKIGQGCYIVQSTKVFSPCLIRNLSCDKTRTDFEIVFSVKPTASPSETQMAPLMTFLSQRKIAVGGETIIWFAQLCNDDDNLFFPTLRHAKNLSSILKAISKSEYWGASEKKLHFCTNMSENKIYGQPKVETQTVLKRGM